MPIVRVGSRESELAVAQARIVMDAIRRSRPDVTPELVTMKTTGDKILDRPLDAVGGKGLFVKELDEALRRGDVDICVHSYKDLPVPGSADLPVVAVTKREVPNDVLVLPEGAPEGEIKIAPGKPIGTSSARRRLQLARLFPGVPCAPVRGNVRTRLRKLDEGEYGALVLAAAGLRRLGLWERVRRVFAAREILPAACQGMLAVQGRAGGDHGYLSTLHDADAFDESVAERAFLAALGAACTSPVAAHAVAAGPFLTLTALFIDKDGEFRSGKVTGERTSAENLGALLALKVKGAHNA